MNGRALAGLAALGIAAFAGNAARMRRARRIDFHGRTIVITGGSRGLGLVLARRFASEGAKIVILARDPGELARAEAQLRLIGPGAVRALRCDVRVRDELEQALTHVRERFGRIDVLVNNAGVIQVGPFEHMTIEDFEEAMDVHFWGPLHAMRAVLPDMLRRRSGRIVNIASIGGQIPVPHLVPYDASKAALGGLSESLRVELVKHGIHVTTAYPIVMRTGSPMNARFKGQHERELAWFGISDALPLVSMDAERAARQIVEACRHGDPTVFVGIHSRIAKVLYTLFPRVGSDVLALVDRYLPPPAPERGHASWSGWESTSRWVPSALTELSDRAALRNNELPGAK